MKINTTHPSLHRFFLPLLILTSFLFPLQSTATTTPNHLSPPSPSHKSPNTYVEDACSVTQYISDCVRSLSPFSNKAKTSPSKWGRASVSVTVHQLETVNHFVKNYSGQISSGSGGGSSKKMTDVISTCVETIQDALDNLHQSLDVMRRLNRSEFDEQMNNVLTWMSAALTDEGTCSDALDEVDKGRSTTVRKLRMKLTKASRFTSNALALVNKLATSGL